MQLKKRFLLRVLKVSAAAIIGAIIVLLLFFWRDITWFFDLQNGFKAFQSGDLIQSESKFKNAVNLAQGFAENDERTTLSLNALATIYMAQAKYADAEPIIKRSLAISEEQHGTDSCPVARILGIYGGFYRRQGKYRQAMPLYNRAVSILENCPGEADQLAEILNDIAKLQLFMGHPDVAKNLYQRTYDATIKKFGSDSTKLVQILNGFGMLEEWRGHYKSAYNQYSKALSIGEAGKESFETGGTLTNIANLKLAEGKLDESLAIANKALICFEQTKGLKLLAAADSASTTLIAEIKIEQGDLSGGEQMLERAASIDALRLGPQHPSMANKLCIKAKLQEKQGLKEQAVASQLKALGIYKEAVGDKHRWVAQSLGWLADLYADQGDNKRAEETYTRALALEAAVMPPQHPDRATILRGYAKLLAATGRAAKAKAIIAQAREILSRAVQE